MVWGGVREECAVPVFAAMLSRRKWPLDKYSKPKLWAILLDMVPFPDPGGPMIAARNSLAILVETRLQLDKKKKISGMLDCCCCSRVCVRVCMFCYQLFLVAVVSDQNFPKSLDTSWCGPVTRHRYPLLFVYTQKKTLRQLFFPSYKLFFFFFFYGYTPIYVFKERLSSANQWRTRCDALFWFAHPEKKTKKKTCGWLITDERKKKKNLIKIRNYKPSEKGTGGGGELQVTSLQEKINKRKEKKR